MNKLILLLLCVSSISSCVPLHEDYYQPFAEQGELRKPFENDTVGPVDTIVFKTEQGVSIRIRCALVEPGGSINLYFDIPKSVEVHFENNLFSLKDLLSEKVIEKKATSVSHYEKGQEIKQDILSLLEGDTESFRSFRSITKKDRRYYIEVELPEFKSIQFKSFVLSSPSIEINGQSYNIPNVTFTKNTDWVVYPVGP